MVRTGLIWDAERLDRVQAQLEGLGPPSASPVPSSRTLSVGDGMTIAGGSSADLSADRAFALDLGGLLPRMKRAAGVPGDGDAGDFEIYFDTTAKEWYLSTGTTWTYIG